MGGKRKGSKSKKKSKRKRRTITIPKKTFTVPRKTITTHRKGKTITYTRPRQTITRKRHQRKDIGAPGRGRKVIPIKKGKLHPYSTSQSAETRRRTLQKKAKQYGATSVYRSLQAQVIFRKRAPDHAKRVFKADRDWVKEKYGIGRGRR